ncbi:MAG: nuclear transport factor 2 family protein [Roseibium sp.]|uniref:nuclear transport factor 2 family protein n=1 Tax=Roseibium sp. TaxID=1936156 RepID=UPI00262D2566|nr:nuclear transport factor 2 family protein [Roseibium sp.]MCV0427009.1 nuclear transport factor 2 family protein [Roseibium sp.]
MTPEQQVALDRFYAGATAQDASMIRPLLTDDFAFKSPLMNFDNPDEYVAHLVGFCGTVSDSRYIAEDNRVVHVFTLNATLPGGEAQLKMCDIFTFKGGKIALQELYTDPGQFPAEA